MQRTRNRAGGATRHEIVHHYDAGTAFYRLFLDETLSYSCPVWADAPGGELLADAQRRKIRRHLDALDLAPNAALLDVGCGWGAALRLALAEGRAATGVGLTLSVDQAAFVRSTAPAGVTVHCVDWRDAELPGPDRRRFDGALCIEALEHFSRPGAGPGSYGEFFATLAGWLAPRAAVSLQVTAVGHAPLDRLALGDLRFIARDVFPGSRLPRLPDLLHAAAPWFVPEHVDHDRAAYARTCRLWHERLVEQRTAAVALVGPEIVARYERYLAASARMFEHGQATLVRLALRRTD